MKHCHASFLSLKGTVQQFEDYVLEVLASIPAVDVYGNHLCSTLILNSVDPETGSVDAVRAKLLLKTSVAV